MLNFLLFLKQLQKIFNLKAFWSLKFNSAGFGVLFLKINLKIL